jgi:3-deoxy-D-manno-octulosonic acid (KDO) 8-phosphate synthase
MRDWTLSSRHNKNNKKIITNAIGRGRRGTELIIPIPHHITKIRKILLIEMYYISLFDQVNRTTLHI